ncbi:MAG: TonB-dependent receptor [Wenzhouxiangella sp.]|nr:TonB-dependent receptor [Wenzhouxiangella sp.]
MIKQCFFALLLPLALPVLATEPKDQTADSQADHSETPSFPVTDLFRLDRIVVTATRTERLAFTTPASVSRISRDEISLMQPYGFQDVFESVPGVSIFGGPRRIAEEPSIRGFADEQVVIRVDGGRLNFNRAHGGRFLLDPELIESIEVLRGAGSALYGSGALGGVFVIETSTGRSRTGERDGVGLRLGGGYDANGAQWQGHLTAYGLHGSFDWLAALTRRDVGEDLVDGSGRDILSTRDEIDSQLLKLGFEPGSNQRFELSIERFDNQGFNPTNSNEVATPSNLVDRLTERRQTRFGYRNDDPALAWLDLTATVYRNEVEASEFRLVDRRVDFTDFDTRGLDLTNSIDLGRRGDEPLRLTVGTEVYRDRQSGLRNGQARRQFPDAEVEYQAAFAQLELPLAGGVALIPGLRYDDFRYSADDDFPDRNESQTTPRLAVGWQPAESTYLWVEYAEAFRAPSLTELYADGVHFVVPLGPGQVVINEFVPTPDLKPEQSRQLQIGARWRTPRLSDSDLSLSLEATAYRSDVDDFVDQFVLFISGPPAFDPITRTLVFPGITSNRNVDARIEGAEFSAELSHPRGYMRLGLTLLDGDRRDGGGALASLQSDRLTLAAGLYLIDRQLRLGGEWIAARARDDVPDGALATPGYGKVDLHAAWLPRTGALAGFEFRLGLDNLLDKAFRIHPNAIDQPGRSLRLSVAREFQWLN